MTQAPHNHPEGPRRGAPTRKDTGKMTPKDAPQAGDTVQIQWGFAMMLEVTVIEALQDGTVMLQPRGKKTPRAYKRSRTGNFYIPCDPFA